MKSLLIRIDPKIYEQLKLKAESSHKSIAALVREIMKNFLEGEALRNDDPVLSLCGKASTSRKDGAKQHDEYIYRRKD
jgi:plasmid stability protein